jgi:lipopolysaccharide export system permease protein
VAGTILFRMILWELCKVFVMALVAITGILLMAGLIAEATQQGLAPGQILAAIPLLIPSTLPYTIPATTLFATCVVYGRLSADNEILAIKASGVNLVHVVKPGVVLGLAMSASTMGLYLNVIPYTHCVLRDMVLSDAEELLYSMLRRHGMINHGQLPYSMFVKSVEGRKLISPVVKRRKPNGQIDLVAHAREAEMHVDRVKNQLVITMRIGVVTGDEALNGDFQERRFDVSLEGLLGADKGVRARDMTWQELRDKRVELEEELEGVEEGIAARTAAMVVSTTPQQLSHELKLLQERKKRHELLVRLIDVEMLMRPALSLGCLCFILVGCPVAIWFSRGEYLSAFITCFLPIIIVYYPLMLCGTNLAKDGRFNMAVLVFGADIIVGLWGALLFRKLLRN